MGKGKNKKTHKKTRKWNENGTANQSYSRGTMNRTCVGNKESETHENFGSYHCNAF